MSERNLSIDAHFNQLAAQHTPAYRFAGTDQNAFHEWRNALLPRLRELLGEMPTRTPLNAETIVEWQADGLIKRKIVFDVEPGLAAHAYVYRPADASGALPTILCCHGHGISGKEGIMGNTGDPRAEESIKRGNDYGLKMAQAGFVTACLDFRGFGDRDDRRKPTYHDVVRTRDICNVHYLRATILGRTLVGMNVHDAQCLLNHLCEQEFVDAQRMGVMGLSFGGTMATWIALCDERIQAANIIGYSDRFADFGMRDVNFCGSQIVPGLYALCDVPDLHGLIAPRPLLVEIGVHDQCFRVQSAMSCYREVEKIYEAAGARDRLELDLHPGGHQWGGNKSAAFFREALQSGG